MKRSLAFATAVVLVFVCAGPVMATGPARYLSRPVLDKFLKDYPLIYSEWVALGSNYAKELSVAPESEDHELNPLQMKSDLRTACADPKIKAILARYGWGDSFADVYVAVIYSAMHVAWEEFDGGYPSKAMLESLDQLRANVNPDDIVLVKANRQRIASVLSLQE